ncbi:aldose 1-epimerase family protein [Sphingomonas sp. DG1-23]|uniref:aldose 1-epimerase family protein n=1 Tax=Sphingomonas sp. DG1-23 TaxID=3068316 RepID=UPI00273FCF2E|nr:aldose 1-epimerase family protein [Sphingomonas sp. DG1-23]MDP5278975.1 aldose 1-epimerase family protein [Sphingomonas sp. DG1-23]
MVALFGETLSRRALAERTGSLSQFAGVQLSTLGDGVERGVRRLEFRTGTGLRFTVLVDRAMDIAECEHSGRAVGWHSPAGFRHPSLHDYEGEGGLGWFRSMSGLNITCGLDHTLFMHEDPAGHYFYGPRKAVSSSLHGRVGTIPARLTGYGERWDGDACVLWAEGVVQQSTVFGEDLHLIRRIEANVGSDEIRMHDRVVNHGFYRTPHMYCYHINAGHPVLAEGSRYVAPIREVLWAAHADKYEAQGVGYRTMPAPILNFHEQVWQHDMAADGDGRVNVALVNEALGFGFEVETLKRQFPAMYQWQNFHAGHYAMGIEPSTNHVLGKDFARERGELIWLEHGDERRYDTVLRILPDAAAVADAVARIERVARQPEEEYPQPSGNFPAIPGRGA